MQARKLTLVEIGVGALPSASPVAPRYSTWFPVAFKAPGVPPTESVTPTPVADGVVLEWDAVDLDGVIYVISRSESQNGPWTEIHRTTETRYVYSDGSGKTWWFQITPTVRGKAGSGTVVGFTPPTTSTDLAEQQAKLAAEISARIQAIADEAAARAEGLAQAARDLVAEALLRQQGVTEALQAVSAEAQARIDAILNEKLAREAAITREEQLRQSADESLARAVSEVAAGSGTQFDSIKLWPFNQTAEGWTGNGAPTLVDGWLRPANHATAPWIQSPVALAIDGSAYRFVKLRVKRVGTPTWGGFLQWITATDQAWNTQKRAAIQEPAWDVNGVATVDVQDIAWWPATVDAIRLQLGTAQTVANYFLVDYVAVGRPQPGASVALVQEETQARITADAAEASQRTTLAVQMRGNYTGTDPAQLTAGLAYEELRARVAADSAQVQRISTMEARMPAGAGSLATAASVTALQEATATTTNALAQSITSLNVSLQNIGGDNLIPNASLDVRASDTVAPTGFVTGASVPSGATLSYVDSDLPGSTKALRRTGTSTAANQYLELRTQDNLVKAAPGQTYVLSAFMRGNVGAGTPTLIIWFLNAAGQTIGSSMSTGFVLAADWQRMVTVPRVAPAGTAFARLYFRVTSTAAGQVMQVDLDNVQFQQGEVATQWSASTNELQGTIAATAAAVSGLTATVSQLGTTVDSQSALITSLRNDVTDVASNSTANTAALQQLGGRVSTAEGKIDATSTSVTRLEGQIVSIGGDNLLWNSSMEDAPVATAAPTGWNLERIRSDVGGTFSYVDSSLSGGGKAVRLDWTAANAKDWVGLNRAGPGSNYVKVDPSTDYTLSSWVRGTAGTKAQLYVQWMNASGGTVLGTVTLPEVVMTNQWQRLILPARSRGDAVLARVYVGRQFADQPGAYAIEIDNVQFQRGLVATEYRPSGQEAITVTTQNVSAVFGLTTRMTNAENKATAQADQLTVLSSSVSASFNRGENLNANAMFDGGMAPFVKGNTNQQNGDVTWVVGGGQQGSAIQMVHKAGAAGSPFVYANDNRWVPLKMGRSGRKLRTVIVAKVMAGDATLTARVRVRNTAGEGNNDQTTPNLTSAWQRFVLEHPVGDDRTEVMSQVWITNRGAGDATVLVDRIEFYDVTDEVLISANASATAGLNTKVTQQGEKLDATATDLTSLKTQVGTVNATAFNQMQTTVQQHDGKINANSQAITGLQVKVEGMPDASVMQEMQASIAQTGGGNMLQNAAWLNKNLGGWDGNWSPDGVQGYNNYASAWNEDGGIPFGCYSLIHAGNLDRAGSVWQWTDVPAQPNKDYIASAYVSGSLRKAAIYVEFKAYNDTTLGTMQTAIHDVPGGGGTIDSYLRIFVKGRAPAGTAFVRFILQGVAPQAGNSFLRWVRPMLQEAQPGQDKPGPWSAGGLEGSASWQVNVRTDGKVAGIKLASSNGVSSFDVLSDVFRVSSPSGGRRTEYSDGHWRCYDENGVMRARFGVWG